MDICSQTRDILPHYISLEFERYSKDIKFMILIRGILIFLLAWRVVYWVVKKYMHVSYLAIFVAASWITILICNMTNYEYTFEKFMETKNDIFLDHINIDNCIIQGQFRYDGTKIFLDGLFQVIGDSEYTGYAHCG